MALIQSSRGGSWISDVKSENPERFISFDSSDYRNHHLLFDPVVISNLDGQLRNAPSDIKARNCSSKNYNNSKGVLYGLRVDYFDEQSKLYLQAAI